MIAIPNEVIVKGTMEMGMPAFFKICRRKTIGGHPPPDAQSLDFDSRPAAGHDKQQEGRQCYDEQCEQYIGETSGSLQDQPQKDNRRNEQYP